MAQTPIPGYDDGAGGNNYETEAPAAVTAEVSVGKTIPVFAEPDSYFHPSYDPAAGTGLNAAGFTWVWSITAGGANVTLTDADNTDPYATIQGDVVGTATINVLETAPAAWGSCDDGAGTDIEITVRALPVVTTSPANGTSYNVCVGDGSLPTNVYAAITDNSVTLFRVVWSLEIATLDGSAAKDEYFDTDKSTSLGAVADNAEEYTEDAPDAVAAAGNYDITSVIDGGSGLYECIGGKSTVYTYTVTSINDRVSRYGDFLTVADVNSTTDDEFEYYDCGANAYTGIGGATTEHTVIVRVNPTPTTGPIYHIESTWAN